MKTPIKIILLILFSVGAVAGVLLFAKAMAAPPANIKTVDQFSAAIKADVQKLDSVAGFTQSHDMYVVLDDKVKRFRTEDVIDNAAADECRKKIDTSYGEHLKDHGFSILNSSNWTGEQLGAVIGYADALSADRLSDGKQAISEELAASFAELHTVQNNYNAALQASRNTGYVNIADAKAKIARANEFKDKQYLKNNSALIATLDAVPGKISASHYNHVNAIVNSLGGYRSVSYDHYMDVLIPRANNAIKEYKNTGIYGGSKKNIAPVEARANSLVEAAMGYYEYNSSDDSDYYYY